MDQITVNKYYVFLLHWLILVMTLSIQAQCSPNENNHTLQKLKPNIFVVLLARNEAHSLPYFFNYFTKLNYPKDRMSLFIRVDHCFDNTGEIMDSWLRYNRKFYRDVDVTIDKSHTDFNNDAYNDTLVRTVDRLVKLKEEAMLHAKKQSADYVLFLDMDVYLTDPNVIYYLINKNETVVSPMLTSLDTYSNFWGEFSEDFWYQRSRDYMSILEREQVGCFNAALVYGCVLINLWGKSIDTITFNSTNIGLPKVPYDDAISFGVSTRKAEISNIICNEKVFGYIDYMPEPDTNFRINYFILRNLMLEIAHHDSVLEASPQLENFLYDIMPSTAGLSQIYYINLDRRRDRRKRMEQLFSLFGLKASRVSAVDGKLINITELALRGIHLMDGYLDPNEGRPMTMGEVGCFLSHYKIWKDVVRKGYNKVAIFEDDAHFEANFKEQLLSTIEDAKWAELEWDVIYLGRKKLIYDYFEPEVPGVDNLVSASYSHWLVGYLLSQSGARKLLAGQPLSNMIPADEYVPLMSDQYYTAAWTRWYPRRTLRVFAQDPLTVEPRFYTGHSQYVSDTEDIDSPRDRLRDALRQTGKCDVCREHHLASVSEHGTL